MRRALRRLRAERWRVRAGPARGRHDRDLGRWVPVDPTPEDTRIAAIDGAIAANTFGTVTPKTVAELKAMSAAEYSAWFDLNVTTPAQAIGVLKRLTLVIIRRLL
jgi:hypothetical protein